MPGTTSYLLLFLQKSSIIGTAKINASLHRVRSRSGWVMSRDCLTLVNIAVSTSWCTRHSHAACARDVRTREGHALYSYTFCLIYLRLRVAPSRVRTQSRPANSPRSYHWAMEAVEDGPKLRIFIVSIWPNLRKYLERLEFNANQERGNFQVRNFRRKRPTPVGTPPSSCRIVNVNSITTQLNLRHLYYIWVRAIEGALFTSFILVGWFPRGCQFLIGRI